MTTLSSTFDISDLNTGQKEAFALLKDYLHKKGNSLFCLRGYAGTGKSYLVKRLIKYIHIKYPGHKVAITAPTNKAVKVLHKMSNFKTDTRVTFQTVHKLLGLKEVIHTDGRITFEQEFSQKNEIEQYKVLIVDEVSMLDDELFHKLTPYSNRIKIIFMGDPAQIPPVGKVDCIPFNDEKNMFFDFEVFSLTEIMRQSLDNPIIGASFEIRNNLSKRFPIEEVVTSINDKDHGVIRIDANKTADRDNAMKLFEKYFRCPEFEADADYSKVIAWRNKTVDKTNSIIRNIIHGTEKAKNKIVVGEKLVVRKPIVEGLNIIVFTTSEELVVEEFAVATDLYKTENGVNRLKYYDTVVSAIDIEGVTYQRTIKIMHEESQADFDRIAGSLKEVAIRTKGAQRSWPLYYEFLRMFADVGYNYAITGHKSQGSTYKNVFVIEDDIDLNPNILERNRLKYTSYSRASERLFVMKR
jgi:ATP-dependent exoDNAse (exonuclease V) alpha subunit